MSMSRPRNPGTIKILCPAGVLIPRPPVVSGPVAPKWQRFYNWPRSAKGEPMPDAPGFPRAEDIKEIVVEVPADQHHTRTLIYNGHCTLVDETPRAAPIVAEAPKGKKAEK